ncbi:MAG: TrmH family RNA methyltransferase [Acidimicrobiales bacterium]
MKQLDGTAMKRLHREWRRKTDARLAQLVEGVQGPFNLGSILRTAAAYRVEHLWIVATDTLPTNPKVGKTALGSERFVQWTACETAAEALALVSSAGFQTVAIELTDRATPLDRIDLAPPTCLILGHEDRGISSATLDAADRVAFLPQLGKIGSLNVATAAAIAMYEARRQALNNG